MNEMMPSEVLDGTRPGSHARDLILLPAYSGDGLAVGEIGRVCVTIWRKQSNRERFERQRAALANLVERHPGEAGFMCVVEKSSEPPDDEYVRRGSATMITDHGAKLAGVSVVSEGTGFRVAVARSLMSGMMFLMRNPAPIRIFDSVPTGSNWLALHAFTGPVAQFVADVEALRQHLDTLV